MAFWGSFEAFFGPFGDLFKPFGGPFGNLLGPLGGLWVAFGWPLGGLWVAFLGPNWVFLASLAFLLLLGPMLIFLCSSPDNHEMVRTETFQLQRHLTQPEHFLYFYFA